MKSRSNLHVWYIWFAYILASLHSHILRFLCTCLYPCILAYSYPYVRVYLLVSSHPYILISSDSYALACILISSGSCALACILESSHNHILSNVILTSSHRHTLRFMCACWYYGILTSSYPQVYVCLLVCLHPHVIVFLIRMNNCILTYSGSLVLGNCASQILNNLQILWTGQAFVLDFYRTSRKIYRK